MRYHSASRATPLKRGSVRQTQGKRLGRAHSTFSLLDFGEAVGDKFEACPNAVAVGLGADQKDLEPMVGVATVVAEELGRAAPDVDGEVQVAIIIEIGGGQPPPGDGAREVGAEGVRNLFEFPLAQVAEHQQRLFVSDLAVIELNVVEHGAVQLADIGPSVVVVVEELHGDAAQQNRFVADAGAVSGVVEGPVVVVAVEAVEFKVEVGDIEVLPAVAVHVGGVNAHARLVLAVFARGHAGGERGVLKSAVVVVEEEEVGPGVVGDGDVGPSVVVEVGEHHAHALGFGFSHAGFLAHVGERAVVVVVIEPDALTFVVVGMAVGAVARPVLAAPEVVLRRPLDIVRDQEVEPAVLVVVEPSGAGGPLALVRHTCFGCDFGKSSVAIVVIKDRAAVTGDVQIRVAVVVEIAHGHPLPVKTFGPHAGFFRDVGECAVAVVAIERGAERLQRFVGVGCARLHEVEVHEAVLVVINPAHARAHGLKVVFLRAGRRILNEGDARAFGDVGVMHRNRGGRGGSEPAKQGGSLFHPRQRRQCDYQEGNRGPYTVVANSNQSGAAQLRP